MKDTSNPALAGQVAVVTGAGRGIGAAIAATLAGEALAALPGRARFDLGGDGPGRTALGIGTYRAPTALLGLQS